ncbi:hypothetical protein STENM223S_09304 [Streptomyces tendae]
MMPVVRVRALRPGLPQLVVQQVEEGLASVRSRSFPTFGAGRGGPRGPPAATPGWTVKAAQAVRLPRAARRVGNRYALVVSDLGRTVTRVVPDVARRGMPPRARPAEAEQVRRAASTPRRDGERGPRAARARTARPTGPGTVPRSATRAEGRVDLGGLFVPGVEGMERRVEVAGAAAIVAATVVLRDSAIQLQAFAAPKREGIWGEVREEIGSGITQQGGIVDEVEGPLGWELRAQVPVQLPDGTGGYQVVRFVGVDGPRWFLRGVISARARCSRRPPGCWSRSSGTRSSSAARARWPPATRSSSSCPTTPRWSPRVSSRRRAPASPAAWPAPARTGDHRGPLGPAVGPGRGHATRYGRRPYRRHRGPRPREGAASWHARPRRPGPDR